MNIENILKIYGIYSNDLQKYNNIIWQFPIALITLNVVSINFFLNKPYVLLFISMANLIMLHALFKHIYHQRAIIKALKQIENELRKYYNEDMIPDFKTNNKIIKIPSADLLFYTLLAMNFVFLLIIIFGLLNHDNYYSLLESHNLNQT